MEIITLILKTLKPCTEPLQQREMEPAQGYFKLSYQIPDPPRGTWKQLLKLQVTQISPILWFKKLQNAHSKDQEEKSEA